MTTSVNTQFHVAKELVNYELGFEIYADIYYDPATWDLAKYNVLCGRGDNTSLHSGMFMPGISASDYFYGRWRSTTSNSAINKSGLTADWYRYSMVVTTTTVQIKLLNLRTNVLLEGNIATVGTIDIADNINFTFLCYGINGLTGAYGSVGVNVANIRILRGSTCLLNVPLSEGVGDKVTDICNSSQYQITFFTVASGWAKLSNYFHHNFRYGFTLYQKSGSADLYIPNTIAQTEISITPPSGYSRVANYKECRQTFNQCESVFVLDSVNPVSDLFVTNATDTILNGAYQRHGDYAGKSYWYDGDLSTYTHFLNWDGFKWCWGRDNGVIMLYSYENVADPWDVTAWAVYLGSLPAGNISEPTSSDLYAADVNFVLFTENTGVAKEINVGTLDVNIGVDRGYLYINPNVSEHDFMLYKTNKTLLNDVKIIKYIGLGGEIVYDESGEVVYDENDHAILEE